MSQAPSMPLFWDALMGDTLHLTTEEFGAYMLLLGAMWRHGGSIPDSDPDLSRITRTGKRWGRVKARLLPFLLQENGTISQKRLRQEWGYVQNRKQIQKQNSEARWNKNKDLDDATALPPLCPQAQAHISIKDKYRFPGPIQRITQKHYDELQTLYPTIPDLNGFLASREAWLSTLPENDPRRGKNWLAGTTAALNKSHQENLRAKQRGQKLAGKQFKPEPEIIKPDAATRDAQIAKMREKMANALVRGDDESTEGIPGEPTAKAAGVRDVLPALQAMDHAQED